MNTKARRPSRKAYIAAQKEYSAAKEAFSTHPFVAGIVYDDYRRSEIRMKRYDEKQAEIEEALKAINVLIRLNSIWREENMNELLRQRELDAEKFEQAMDSDEVRAIRDQIVTPHEEEMMRLRKELLEAGWTDKEV